MNEIREMRLIVKTTFVLALVMCFVSPLRAQIEGIEGWKLFLDPGHSGYENMGLFHYSEAEKNLRVTLELRDRFEAQTNISELHLCRLTDEDHISLEGRTALANELGVDFYYSIHSDAGGPSHNSTLMLYGGWRKDGITIEKTPGGGALLGDILSKDLSKAMRIPTRGNYADRVFYLGNTNTHENQWPYLHVNRTTTMPSLLSESGFHTNPEQQQLNLNSEWKKLEALSAFRSFLEFHEIDRPAIGVVTGVVTDKETGTPVNGITVTINDKKYTTDTYESLFNQYSNDPDELHNGFFWIEGLMPEEVVEVVFESDHYKTQSLTTTIVSKPNGLTSENLTFADVQLISNLPPVVDGVSPANVLENLIPGTDVKVSFTRKMDPVSVEASVSINPEVPLSFAWIDSFTMVIETEKMAFNTNYGITIHGDIARNAATQQYLDGDNDGEEGGHYQLYVTTHRGDVTPPELITHWPSQYQYSHQTLPVIRLVFDEEIMEESVDENGFSLTPLGEKHHINGEIHHAVVKQQSVIHYFPTDALENNKSYKMHIAAGLKDMGGNTTENQAFLFSVEQESRINVTLIDDFNDNITGWWFPQESGSTSGIITGETTRLHEPDMAVLSQNSTGSMKLSYGWQEGADNYIRLHLPPNALQNKNKFSPKHTLQVYLFGDGSGNKFRFMIKDGQDEFEAGVWHTIDWKGWKLVSWDLTGEPSYPWVNGDGRLDGEYLILDGLHFRRGNNGDRQGTLYFDDLRYVVNEANTEDSVDGVIMYPNPAQNSLNIKAEWNILRVRILNFQGEMIQQYFFDNNSVNLDLRALDEGLYLIRVDGKQNGSAKKILIDR
jgi:N-acetylmuramoyl-L-alanine amidase